MADLTVPIWRADAQRLMFDPNAVSGAASGDSQRSATGKDTSRVVNLRTPPAVSPTFLMMAASDMHKQDRFFTASGKMASR